MNERWSGSGPGAIDQVAQETRSKIKGGEKKKRCRVSNNVRRCGLGEMRASSWDRAGAGFCKSRMDVFALRIVLRHVGMLTSMVGLGRLVCQARYCTVRVRHGHGTTARCDMARSLTGLALQLVEHSLLRYGTVRYGLLAHLVGLGRLVEEAVDGGVANRDTGRLDGHGHVILDFFPRRLT